MCSSTARTMTPNIIPPSPPFDIEHLNFTKLQTHQQLLVLSNNHVYIHPHREIFSWGRGISWCCACLFLITHTHNSDPNTKHKAKSPMNNSQIFHTCPLHQCSNTGSSFACGLARVPWQATRGNHLTSHGPRFLTILGTQTLRVRRKMSPTTILCRLRILGKSSWKWLWAFFILVLHQQSLCAFCVSGQAKLEQVGRSLLTVFIQPSRPGTSRDTWIQFVGSNLKNLGDFITVWMCRSIVNMIVRELRIR